MAPISFLFAAFEAWAVTKLLRSPVFHKGVQQVYRKINKIPTPYEELGGMKLDKPKGDSFFKMFVEEVKADFKSGVRGNSSNRKS